MAIKDFTKVFNDEQMRYDYENSRYVLTVDYASWATSRPLVQMFGSEENVEAILEKVSQITYDYLLTYKRSELHKKTLYYLSHSLDMRRAIRQIMEDVAFYGFQEGGWAMAYVSGINLQEVKNMPISTKTMVGTVGHEIARNTGLIQKYFKYHFDLVESNTEDRW